MIATLRTVLFAGLGWGATSALVRMLRTLDAPQDAYRARLRAHPGHTHPGHRGLCHGGPTCPDSTPNP